MKVIINALCTLLLAVSTANHAAAHSKKDQVRHKIQRYLKAKTSKSHPSDHAEMEDMEAVEWQPGSYTFGTYFEE
jgi:hypothetical protein